MQTIHEKKIITFNAIVILQQQNPDLSFREICFNFYKKARSKRIKIGFNVKSAKSFYDCLIKFYLKNFDTSKIYNSSNIKELILNNQHQDIPQSFIYGDLL
jgi:hypothetical protein